MKAYVVTTWKANNQPIDDKQNYVHIRGRAMGIVSWFLSLLKISPTVSLEISNARIAISEGSLSGSANRVLPLENVCSTFYGYRKPIREAIALGVFLAIVCFNFFAGSTTQQGYGFGVRTFNAGTGTLGALIGVAIAVVYYIFNKKLTVGFVENSGVINTIAFKGSMIEGQQVDEQSAKYVAELTQALIDERVTGRQPVKV
jgi:hypothetical protein